MKRSFALAVMAGLIIFSFCQGEAGRRSAGQPAAVSQTSSEGAVAPGLDPPAAGQARPVGIGPVKSLSLGPVDQALADNGKALFEDRCAMCHGLGEAKSGPAVGNILNEVAPEYVMNFLLNTGVMEQKDARIIGLIKKFTMPMPAPGLDKDQARAILEYLRTTKKQPRP